MDDRHWCCNFEKFLVLKLLSHFPWKIASVHSVNCSWSEQRKEISENNFEFAFMTLEQFSFQVAALVPFVLHSSRNLIRDGYFCIINLTLHCNGSVGRKDWAREQERKQKHSKQIKLWDEVKNTFLQSFCRKARMLFNVFMIVESNWGRELSNYSWPVKNKTVNSSVYNLFIL